MTQMNKSTLRHNKTIRETITAPLQKSSYKMFMRTLKEQGQKSAGGALR